MSTRSHRRTIATATASITTLFLALPLTSRAQQTPPAKNASGNASSDALAAQKQTVTYSGRVLFRIRTGVAGYTAEQRADAIRERLVPILSLENLKPEDVTVQQSRPYQDANIYVRDRLLLTVDKGLAQANGNNDPGDLARTWADNMRRLLPTISVKPENSPFRPNNP